MFARIATLLVALGYVAAAAAPSVACACCGTWQVANVAVGDVLNIRLGPGSGYAKVGTIPFGSACVIKTGACKRNWCRIGYAQMSGWVNMKYLRYLK